MNVRAGFIVAGMLGMLGCFQPQTRLQALDDAEKEPEVQTIGDLSSFSNAEAIQVSGVGLVVGLEGTGGDAPPGSYRNFLEDQLTKAGVRHPKEILASPDNSMVLVSARIPPGAHKNDLLDVQITLPAHSKTTSLRGGYLKECYLFNYDTTQKLDSSFQGANRLLKGHNLARAEGAVIVGVGADAEANDPRHGQVWGGGRSLLSRPLYIVFNKNKQAGPIVQQVTRRINETFHGPLHGAFNDIAVAKTTSYLVLQVPLQYRYNLARFMRVVRLIPVEDVPGPNSPYRKRLERDLLDPARTITAALRLEALGNDSVAALKPSLESANPLVRFAAAEALAYLGDQSSGQVLADLVKARPDLRALSLAALASLDEAISHVKLRELFQSPEPDVRYGAFRALRYLDEHDEAVQGELLNDSFWLHHVAAGSPPLVHYATSQRAEVVLFGDGIALMPPFYFSAGSFTITATPNDDRCTLSRLSLRSGVHRKQCGLGMKEVLRALADLGATYPEIIDFLHQADVYHSVNCPIAVDALPKETSPYDLVKEGTEKAAAE